MRKLFAVSGILICAAMAAQNQTFSLQDTTLFQGSVYRNCIIEYLFDDKKSLGDRNPCLDSVADFMLKHPEVIWEIGSHTDQRGTDTFNTNLSQTRANEIEKYLVSKGVPGIKIVPVGYGESQPVHNQKEINAAETKEKKELLYQENRRTEFKVLYQYAHYFSLTDTSFTERAFMLCWVYFDLNKATLRPESLPLLDSIARFLIVHPELVIEVRNHRDTRGSAAYGSNLTAKRAQSVCDYLITKGVEKSQVTGKGYGEIIPLVPDSYIQKIPSKEGQEALHQVNRRTELTIISIK